MFHDLCFRHWLLLRSVQVKNIRWEVPSLPPKIAGGICPFPFFYLLLAFWCCESSSSRPAQPNHSPHCSPPGSIWNATENAPWCRNGKLLSLYSFWSKFSSPFFFLKAYVDISTFIISFCYSEIRRRRLVRSSWKRGNDVVYLCALSMSSFELLLNQDTNSNWWSPRAGATTWSRRQ